MTKEGVVASSAFNAGRKRSLLPSDESCGLKKSTLCHPEQLTCLWQVEGENDTAKIAIDARPGGPTAKRQPSPEGLGKSIPKRIRAP
jgi:hypothetical protein